MIELDFDNGGGIIPAIAQDCRSGEVLMLAYMNRDSFAKTMETGKATYWSRSRNALWVKGETSGNVQFVKEILVDCDNDAIVLKIEQAGGAACHTGYRSCFFRKISGGSLEVIGERIYDPGE
jgi:phosphoribosyl-AMP cyclohydrolase